MTPEVRPSLDRASVELRTEAGTRSKPPEPRTDLKPRSDPRTEPRGVVVQQEEERLRVLDYNMQRRQKRANMHVITRELWGAKRRCVPLPSA